MNILVIILCIASTCRGFFNFQIPNMKQVEEFFAQAEKEVSQNVNTLQNRTAEALPVVQQVVVGFIENGTAHFNVTNIQNGVVQSFQQVQNLSAQAAPVLNSVLYSALQTGQNLSVDAQKAGAQLMKETDGFVKNFLIPKAQDFAPGALNFLSPVWSMFTTEGSACAFQCANKSKQNYLSSCLKNIINKSTIFLSQKMQRAQRIIRQLVVTHSKDTASCTKFSFSYCQSLTTRDASAD
jgi:hypothetical protein